MSLNKIMFKTLAALAMANAMALDEDIYSSRKPSNEGTNLNPNYRHQSIPKELRKFKIKGEDVMAYSRKDAIKRLKHKKK